MTKMLAKNQTLRSCLEPWELDAFPAIERPKTPDLEYLST
jgi:hypothetical protein